MSNEELVNAIRLLVREEVTSAVYASEQRTGERLDRMEVRLTAIESDVSVLKTDVSVLKTDMTEVKRKLDQTIAVLDTATYAINDLQQSQHSLESKVDDNTRSMKREMQKFGHSIQNLSEEFREFKEDIQARIAAHEDTPIDKAHPRSNL